jgi:hypothetical protein
MGMHEMVMAASLMSSRESSEVVQLVASLVIGWVKVAAWIGLEVYQALEILGHPWACQVAQLVEALGSVLCHRHTPRQPACPVHLELVAHGRRWAIGICPILILAKARA